MSMKATYISRVSERGQVSVPVAIRNALGLTPSSRVAWTLDAENGTATFRLIDGGTPFDPLAKADPDTMLSGEEREIGGLGIFMVKTMVDEVEYEYRDGCNRLTLRKQL